MRKLSLVFVILFGVALLAGCQGGKSYSADRFDVDAVLVGHDGSLQVTEMVVFRFVGGPFTYVYRNLPTNYTDGINDIRVAMDGKPFTAGTGPGQVEIQGNDPIKIKWHFAPTFDSTHTFVLTYRMSGVVRQESDADLLLWDALPDDYNYRIASATVRVSYPSAAKLIPGPAIRRGGGTVTTGRDNVTFAASNLRSNAPLRIEMRFAPGSMIEEPPTWQTREARAQLSAPYFGAAAVAILLLGALVLVLLWNRYPRPQREKAAFRPTVPPGDLPPAIAGALNGVGAQPRWVNALATLFDLARRGALSVEETGEKAWYRRHDFRINLLNRPAELRLHERGLLRLLFETKEGMVESVRLADLQGRVARHFKWFNEPLKEEMQSAGLLDSQRLRMRNWFFALGFILLVADGLSTIAGALLIQRFGGWPFIVMVSFFLLSMAAFVMGGVYSPLSDRGAEEATRWHGFYEYLRDVTKGREPAWDARQFERYLPYAASYGLAEKWARAFQRSAHRGPSAPKLGQRDGVEIPPWFHALATAPDQSMASFAAFTAASHSTGSSGAGGAGGAAGGGGSGAG